MTKKNTAAKGTKKKSKADKEFEKDFGKVCEIWEGMDMAMRKQVAHHGGVSIPNKVLAKEIKNMTPKQQEKVIDALHTTALKAENKKATKNAKKAKKVQQPVLRKGAEKRFEVVCIMDDESEYHAEWVDTKAEATKIRKRILQSGLKIKGHKKPLKFNKTHVLVTDHKMPEKTETKKTKKKAKSSTKGTKVVKGNEVTVLGEKFSSIRSAIMHLMKIKGVDEVSNEECEKIAKKINPKTKWQKTHYYYYRKIVKQEEADA